MLDDDFAPKRRRMLDAIAQGARDTAGWTGRRKLKEATMGAMEAVPRHAFVRERERVAAYVDRPQQIGFGQTISQPFMVALMTDLLNLQGDESVLEIGTGSGFQAAVLAHVLAAGGGHVYSMERVPELATRADTVLQEFGYKNVTTRLGNGFDGWPEAAPFEAIMVTAAPTLMPPTLAHQLKPGGRMVIPIGRAHDRQMLTVVSKHPTTSELVTDAVLPVAFVPMVAQPGAD